jgi:LemA protein
MKGGSMNPVWIIVIVVALLVLFVIFMFNRLVRLRNEVTNAWAQIDVQLKRRHDLIPNLIETVRGYMKHERETLEAVTEARTRAMNAKDISDKIEAEKGLMGTLIRLFAVAENYPDLKASTNFLALQEELASTENKISFARQYYNDVVYRYNTATQVFPANIIAGIFGFKAGTFFTVENEAERAAPKVSF